MTDSTDGVATALRIAMVAPLYESVPPKLYSGTERVVSFLTEELVRLGMDVTLFASGDSVTNARLHPGAPQGLRLDRQVHDPLASHFAMIHDVMESADEFDIVHFHIDYLHFPMSRALALNQVTTLHGRLDLPELAPLYRRFDDMPLVSISDSQRRPLPFANWVATVHHGLPRELLSYSPKSSGYLAFLGRISPEKGTDRAVRIAQRTGMPLRIAAKVDDKDREYYETVVKPLIAKGGDIEFVGEIDDAHKAEFLGGALALLCPIDWPEPFGLVLIEAAACGTPVIAWASGSVPEIVRDGVSGRIVSSEEEAVKALADVERIDRAACRREFEERFTAQRMARDYLHVYRRMLESAGISPSAAMRQSA